MKEMKRFAFQFKLLAFYWSARWSCHAAIVKSQFSENDAEH